MDQTQIFLIILGMALVTYLPRVLPLWLLSSRSLPPVVTSWLRFVPVAVLSAMLLPALLIKDKQVDVGVDNLFLWAAIPAFVVAWRTKSFFGTVLTGMVVVAAARFLSAV